MDGRHKARAVNCTPKVDTDPTVGVFFMAKYEEEFKIEVHGSMLRLLFRGCRNNLLRLMLGFNSTLQIFQPPGVLADKLCSAIPRDIEPQMKMPRYLLSSEAFRNH